MDGAWYCDECDYAAVVFKCHDGLRLSPARAVPIEPAPQPPADAATVKYSCDLHQDCVNKLAPHYNQKPAAPPVSGDEDIVREIANRHVSAGYCCFTNAMVAVREALERGRALGARDAASDAVDIAKRRWYQLVEAGGDQLDYVTLDDACVESFSAGQEMERKACAEWVSRVYGNSNGLLAARRSGGQGK
jgi:hypothetical protein